jgi:glycosyltransferase 2 family protein
MLAYLLSRLHLSSLLPHRGAVTLAWVVAGVLVTGVSVLLSTLRWQRVLVTLELPARLRNLLGHYLAGLFVGNFLPSTIGGDVLRVTRLSAENGSPPSTFASVVLERLSGWIVLPVITLATMAVQPTLLHKGSATRLAVFLSVGTLVLLAGVVLAIAHPRLLGRHADNPGWLRFVGAVHLGIDRLRRHPAAAASVLGAGFVYQFTVVLAAWIAAEALGVGVSFTVLLAFFPAVAIAQVLPITFSGLGVREGALVLFLRPFDVSSGHAIALGLLFYAFNLVVSLFGAPPFAVGVRSKSLSAAT